MTWLSSTLVQIWLLAAATLLIGFIAYQTARNFGALKKVFADEPGTSFGRLACTFVLANLCGWGWLGMYRAGMIPDMKGLDNLALYLYVGGKGIGALRDIMVLIKGGQINSSIFSSRLDKTGLTTQAAASQAEGKG